MKKIGKIKNYVLAFIIPIIICMLSLHFKGILKNIEYMYVSDLRLQHVVFLNYLKEILLNKASLFYTFTAGMGSSMLSTVVFYCISPINILLLFFKDIRYAILIIYLVKVGLAGLTMYILLKSKTEDKEGKFITVVFSTCYALCAFVINYFFCVFWFDCLYLAPLVVLGIDRLVQKEKISLLYILSLALTIICNIQMGFGLCMFSVIYYLYSFNIKYHVKKDFKKFIHLGIIFAISSLCAGAISSGVLFGFMSSYGDISSARAVQITTSPGVANIFYILKNIFTVGNLKTDYYNSFEPFVYSGLIVSFFSIIYLFNKDIDKRKRIHAFLVILVFVISFCVNFINLFWHLSSPVLLNFRYSEYLGLFLTMMAYECYVSKDKLNRNDITVLVLSLLVGLFMIIAYSNEVYVAYTFAFLIAISLFILLVKNKSKKLEIVLVLLVFAELVVNGYLSIYTAVELPFGKYSSYDSFKEIAMKNNFDDNYRVMYNYSYTDLTNDTLLLNKNSSLRYFSSVINGDVIIFLDRNNSNVGNNNYRVSAYDSPLLLSLLGNKYFYLVDDFSNGIYNKKETYNVGSFDYVQGYYDYKDVYLYENPYALTLGYVIDSDVKYEKNMDTVDYQNAIMRAFSGYDKNIMIRLDYTTNENEESCVNSNYYSCMGYAIRNNTKNKQILVYSLLTEYSVKNKSKMYLNGVKPLLISTLDNNVNLVLKYQGDLTKERFLTATYDKDNLIEGLKLLQKNMLNNITIDKNIMKANLNTDKDGILLLTIPYDKNFKIYVDNKKVDYYSVLDKSFVGLDVTKGEHDIKVEYTNDNFKLYVLGSLGGLIITLVLYFVINRKINKKNIEKKLEEERILLERQKKQEEKKNKKAKKKK